MDCLLDVGLSLSDEGWCRAVQAVGVGLSLSLCHS